MKPLARLVDAVLEASVIGSFSRIGISARSRLLPEFTRDRRPPFDGRVAVMTGATSGIGKAAAIQLAGLGGTVHFLARDRVRAARAQHDIATAAGRGTVSFAIADLDDLASVRAFAEDAQDRHGRIDVLIHNAGAVNPSYRASAAGIERTVAGQLAAPFLLTRLLLPALLAAGSSRVVTVSSGGMYTQRAGVAGLQLRPPHYHGVTAYARVKRAQAVLSAEWARRLAGTGVACHAMHPGWADTPGMARDLPGFRRLVRPVLRSPEQGADTLAWLATADPRLLGSGTFWHDRRPRSTTRLPWAPDASPAAARELWDCVAAWAGLSAGAWSGPGQVAAPAR